MNNVIQFGSEIIPYTLNISTRAKKVRLTVSLDTRVVLTVPGRLWGRMGEAFVHQMLQSRADQYQKHKLSMGKLFEKKEFEF